MKNLLLTSIDFVLQENSDVTTANWAAVPTVPVLNVTNMRSEVIVPGTNGNRFFRLSSP